MNYVAMRISFSLLIEGPFVGTGQVILEVLSNCNAIEYVEWWALLCLLHFFELVWTMVHSKGYQLVVKLRLHFLQARHEVFVIYLSLNYRVFEVFFT